MIVCSDPLHVDASRLFVNTNSDYVEVTSDLTSDTLPFTACGWIYPTATTAGRGIFTVEVAGTTDNRHRIVTQTSSTITVSTRAGTDANATTVATFTINTWHHVCGVWINDSNRWVYLDGGNAVQNTQTRNPTGMNRTRFGRFNEPPVYFGGRLSHWTIWNVELTPTEIASLANKTPPNKIRPLNRIACVPMWGIHSPEIDACAARSWTIGGTPAIAPGPPVGLFTQP